MPTPPVPILYPQINGVRYGYSSIVFGVNGRPIAGIDSIDYSQSLKAGIIRGTLPNIQGATRGQLEAKCSFTMYLQEYYNYIAALQVLNGTPGSGHMEVRHDIQLTYQDTIGPFIGPLIVDVVRGFKIEEASRAFKSDNGALMVKVDCDSVFYILENGAAPIGLQSMSIG
jgi:hypothetical protein